MKTYIVCRAVEQHTHRLLGTPHGLVLVIDLHALLLSFNLEDQELCGAISYFSALGHIMNDYRSSLIYLRICPQ